MDPPVFDGALNSYNKFESLENLGFLNKIFNSQNLLQVQGGVIKAHAAVVSRFV
jgi:hypothetical protein